MSEHVDASLISYTLGILSQRSQKRVQAHLQSCARCGNMEVQTADELAQLALALPPVAPPVLVREGLLHALGEVNRFTDLIMPLARMLQMPAHAVEPLLDTLDITSAWDDTLIQGAAVCAIADRSDACFMRVVPGHRLTVPGNTALNRAFLLQGTCRDAHNRLHRTGDTLRLHRDSAVNCVVLPAIDMIYLAI